MFLRLFYVELVFEVVIPLRWSSGRILFTVSAGPKPGENARVALGRASAIKPVSNLICGPCDPLCRPTNRLQLKEEKMC